MPASARRCRRDPGTGASDPKPCHAQVAAQYVMSPPIRGPAHQARLRGALAGGLLGVVATDHAPFNSSQKAAGAADFRAIPNGVNGIEERLHVTWDALVAPGARPPPAPAQLALLESIGWCWTWEDGSWYAGTRTGVRLAAAPITCLSGTASFSHVQCFAATRMCCRRLPGHQLRLRPADKCGSRAAHRAGLITPSDFVRLTSTAAARAFNAYPRKGVLAPGSDADVIVFDPAAEHTLSASTHHSRMDTNIYEGRAVRGRARPRPRPPAPPQPGRAPGGALRCGVACGGHRRGARMRRRLRAGAPGPQCCAMAVQQA